MRHWYVRFLLRLVFYGGVLYFVLRKTATHFDITEVDAILWFLGAMIAFEGVLGIAGGSARKREGKAVWHLAVAIGFLAFTLHALRPRVSEVSVTYTGTMSLERLAILAEIVRW